MLVYYNTDTGEVFKSREEAIQDAADWYDYGDETNVVTYLGFPNIALPYIEIEERKLAELVKLFG